MGGRGEEGREGELGSEEVDSERKKRFGGGKRNRKGGREEMREGEEGRGDMKGEEGDEGVR